MKYDEYIRSVPHLFPLRSSTVAQYKLPPPLPLPLTLTPLSLVQTGRHTGDGHGQHRLRRQTAQLHDPRVPRHLLQPRRLRAVVLPE